MSDSLYELLALAFRYFFAALMLLIVFRAWRITIKDNRRAAQLRRWSPETGLAGELIVIDGGERAQTGMRYPVIREGIIGSARKADVRIRHSSVNQTHAHFERVEEGIVFTVNGNAKLYDEDGARVRRMLSEDGGELTVGEVSLMLILSEATAQSVERQTEELFDVSAPEDIPMDELFEPKDAWVDE